MALTNVKIQNAKAKGKPYKLYDEMGLLILVPPSGSKLWNLKYRYLDKEKKLSFGAYPNVSLKEARRLRSEARALLDNGLDPAREKKRRSRPPNSGKPIHSMPLAASIWTEWLWMVERRSRSKSRVGSYL